MHNNRKAVLLISIIYDELMEIGEKSTKLNFLPFNFFDVLKNGKRVFEIFPELRHMKTSLQV